MPVIHINITNAQRNDLKKIAKRDNDKKLRVQNEEMVQFFIDSKKGSK